MFRKTRISKRLLVVGLGLAALAAPSAGLAGGYSGQGLKALNAKSQAENTRYGGHDGYSFQAWQAIVAKGEAMNQRYGGQSGLSQQAFNAVVAKGDAMNQRYGTSSSLDPNSPETRARLVAQGYVDGSLYRQSSNGLIDGRSPDTQDAALAASQPYGPPDGWTPYVEQLTRESQSASVLDGRSQDTKDAAVLAHEPVVTITKTPGFQWGDFAIGTGVAVAAMILLALSLRFLSNRQGRKPGSVATA
jgi:hypothetical protein